jgi:hypothetical protein
MYQEEQTFALKFSLEASFPDEYEGDADNKAWVREWEAQMKPQIIKLVFESLRTHPGWTSRIRNRGISPTDEIEIVLARDFSQPLPFSI